jgi:two-component sensor histidine kinase
LGLILNELVINAVKYAFPDDRAGVIRVSLQRRGEQLCLTVSDDGVGFRGPNRDHGKGQELIAALCQQLEGRLHRQSTDHGAIFSIVFPIQPYRQSSCDHALERLQ